jgi:hypothetical protein
MRNMLANVAIKCATNLTKLAFDAKEVATAKMDS